jgi:hypothetical protein
MAPSIYRFVLLLTSRRRRREILVLLYRHGRRSATHRKVSVVNMRFKRSGVVVGYLFECGVEKLCLHVGHKWYWNGMA